MHDTPALHSKKQFGSINSQTMIPPYGIQVKRLKVEQVIPNFVPVKNKD